MYPENIHFCQFVVCLFLTKAAYVPQTAEACQTVKNVPLTMARCFTELTPAERFAIYDYVVDRGKATNKTPSIKLEDLQVNFEKKPNEGKLSFLLFTDSFSNGVYRNFFLGLRLEVFQPIRPPLLSGKCSCLRDVPESIAQSISNGCTDFFNYIKVTAQILLTFEFPGWG